ncbi:hypothetical protein BH09PLA1_BH09PLA1_14290 [soil metagenome]
MRKFLSQYLLVAIMATAISCLGSIAQAQQAPDQHAPDKNTPDKTAPDKNDPNNPDPNNPDPNDPQGGVHVISPGPGTVFVTMGGGGGGQHRMRLGPGPMMMGDALERFINMLGMVNLQSDFSLSADQKTKIQAIRDDFKQQTEKWKSEHADELKQMDEQQEELMTNLQNGNPPDPNQMMEMEQARHELMQTAPNGEDQVEQIKALFTPEQAKTFDEQRERIEKERQAQFQKMGGRFFPGMPPPPPADPNAQPGDRKGK